MKFVVNSLFELLPETQVVTLHEGGYLSLQSKQLLLI